MPEFFWKWRREIIFSLLIIVSLGLLVSHHEPGLLQRALCQGVKLIVVPFQRISTALIKRYQETLASIASIKRLHQENLALKQKLEKFQLRHALLLESVRENEILRQQLGYLKQVPWQFIPAEVIGRDPASWLKRAVLDRGSMDGVKAGAGVITPEGVVGRILDVNLHAATILLLLDVQSSVAGTVERSRISGTIKGTGTPTLKMLHVSSEDDVQVGDQVLSSKLSSLFPPGLLIGQVTRVKPSENGLMLDIDIKPSVHFKTLDHMLILQPED